jgi:hypothetical protein
MAWTTLTFGKYAGKTLPQVLFSDPDWFFWAFESGAFKTGKQKAEAEQLHYKATHIKVPQSGKEKMVVDHFIHRPTMKYSHFEVVPEDRERHAGASPTLRDDVIDMRVPRQIAKYDKTGNKTLITSLKYHYFASRSARMTKERCEAFFDNPDNFV